MHRLSHLLLSCLLAALVTISVTAKKDHHDHHDNDNDDNLPVAPLALLNAPSASSSWLTRSNSSYQLLLNDSITGVQIISEWVISSVNDKIKTYSSHDKLKTDKKVLKHYLKKLDRKLNSNYNINNNSSPSDSHHYHNKKHGHKNQLNYFYLNHAQCRQCVSSNLAILQSSTLPTLSSFQPNKIMKFCPLIEPKLSNEISPLVSGKPLQDYEGYCIPAELTCPNQTIDMNILDQSTCNNDQTPTKLSCTLCVLDSYTWKTTNKAFKTYDNYDGECIQANKQLIDSHNQYNNNNNYHSIRYVNTLNSCPTSFANNNNNDDYYYYPHFSIFSMAFFGIFFLSCMYCCVKRRQNKLALARRQQSLLTPQIQPMPIAVASAPEQSIVNNNYPGNSHFNQQPHHQAAAEHVEPLLSAPYPYQQQLPSYGPAYPIVQPTQSYYRL